MTSLRRAAATRYLLDVVCIVLFVVIGRRNHGETTDAAGTLRTALPFFIALTGAWIGARAGERRARSPRVWCCGSSPWS